MNSWVGYQMGPSLTPHPPKPQTGGRKGSLSNCSQMVGGQRKCQQNLNVGLENRNALAKAPTE